MDAAVFTRTVKCYTNKLTKDTKALLNRKKRVFGAVDKELLKSIQMDLKRNIKEARETYKRKLEGKLQQNNMSEVWRGMKAISCFRQKSRGSGW